MYAIFQLQPWQRAKSYFVVYRIRFKNKLFSLTIRIDLKQVNFVKQIHIIFCRLLAKFVIANIILPCTNFYGVISVFRGFSGWTWQLCPILVLIWDSQEWYESKIYVSTLKLCIITCTVTNRNLLKQKSLVVCTTFFKALLIFKK